MFEPRGHDMMSGSILYPAIDPAGGMGMMGLSLGSAAGKVVSELARQGQPSADIRLFDPERFH